MVSPGFALWIFLESILGRLVPELVLLVLLLLELDLYPDGGLVIPIFCSPIFEDLWGPGVLKFCIF